MRKVVLLLFLAGTVLPALAAKRVTVGQLEQVLTGARAKPDAKVAQRISDLELTERLSAAKLSRWSADLPGPESRRSLVMLADLSAFLDPPADEIPPIDKPDVDGQRRMMALTVDYASKTIHLLPNFLARRDTVRFEDTPERGRGGIPIPYEPLHPVGRSTGTVLYRDGAEVVDSPAAQGKKDPPKEEGLITKGVFGPIFGTVLLDAAHGKLAWSHWEQGATGPEAVFRYSVPRAQSHYDVGFCCVLGSVVQRSSGYHGEIGVDPANGAILRLTLDADLEPADLIVKSDILVEYGPVEIEGKTYICPLRSLSLSVAPALTSNNLHTLLNDAVFVQYHEF